jgi:hypothetical protein
VVAEVNKIKASLLYCLEKETRVAAE